MKKIKSALPILLSIVLISVGATGCKSTNSSSGSSLSGSSVASSQGTAEKQIMTANIQTEPAQLNSILTVDVPSMNILLAVQEGLTRTDQENNVVPGLAEKWDISEDKLTYTFHLRDAKWSDGTDVTSDDFLFAWMTLLNKDSGASMANLFYSIKGAQAYYEGTGSMDDVGIKAPDAKTFEVTLVRPTPYFTSLCGGANFLPVNRAFYEKQGSGADSKYGTDVANMLYNGPWTMTEWAHNNKIVLTKNDSYYAKDAIKLDQIDLLMVAEANTAYNMFISDSLDTTELNGGDQITLAKNSGYEVQNFSSGGTTFMAFNIDNEIMKNKNIRKAFSYAIDRESFVTNVLKNGSQAAYSLTNPVVKGNAKHFQEEVADKMTSTDMSEAKSFLEKGMAELGLTQMPKVTFLIDDRESIKTQAAVYQEYWRKNLGVEVEIESMSYKAKLAKQYAKDFMITISGWQTSYDDPLAFLELFLTNDANNSISYSNPEYDALVEKGKNETDTVKHYETLLEAELLLLDDAPIAPLYYSNTSYIIQPDIDGYFRSFLSNMNFYYAQIK